MAIEQSLLLKSVTIRNFRSLLSVGPLKLDEQLTVLAGENDGGKTATLDALGFLLGRYQVDSEDFAHNSGQPIVVEAECTSLEDDETVTYQAISEGPRVRRVEILDRVHSEFGGAPDSLTINQLRERINSLNIPSPGGNQKAPLLQAVREWIAGRPSTDFEERWRPASQEEQGRLPHYSRFDSVAAPSPRQFVSTLVARELRRLTGLSQYAEPFADLSRRLSDDIQPSLQRLRGKIQSYCPDLEDVEIPVNFDFTRPASEVDIRVRRRGEDFDLEKSGEGRKRKIALAVHETTLATLEAEQPEFSEVFAYDEPDSHLDYSAQRALFDILERQGKLAHVQLIVATHSLNFIDKVPLQSLLHYGLDEELNSKVEVLVSEEYAEEMDFLASLCNGLGLRNSILLDERCFLVVEGETEEFALPAMFKKFHDRSLVSAGITLFNTHGNSGARKIVDILAKEWGRRVVLLLDADAGEATRSWIMRFGPSDSAEIFMIGPKEFEDAFADEIWLRTLETHFPPEGVPWTSDEIAGLRNDPEGFGTALRNLVSRRCRRRVGKPELGGELARTLGRDELPALLTSVFSRAVDFASS